MKSFPRKLSQLLEDSDTINSATLSDIAGISRAQVSRILSGTRVMTPEGVGAISVLFDEKEARELLSAHLIDQTPVEFKFERGVFQGIMQDGNYLMPGGSTSQARNSRTSVASTKACMYEIEQAALANDDVRKMVHSLATLCRKL